MCQFILTSLLEELRSPPGHEHAVAFDPNFSLSTNISPSLALTKANDAGHTVTEISDVAEDNEKFNETMTSISPEAVGQKGAAEAEQRTERPKPLNLDTGSVPEENIDRR